MSSNQHRRAASVPIPPSTTPSPVPRRRGGLSSSVGNMSTSSSISNSNNSNGNKSSPNTDASLTSSNYSNPVEATATLAATMNAASHHLTQRRYAKGERVLLWNHQSRWGDLVNQYGFPDAEGATSEEQRGPYIYVLATVTMMHFDEDSQYYSVVRADTQEIQRADGEYMLPLGSERGLAAALNAASRSGIKSSLPDRNDSSSDSNHNSAKNIGKIMGTCLVRFYDTFMDCIGNNLWHSIKLTKQTLKKQAELFLNGNSPYSCQIPFTGVTFLVICTIWYAFCDLAIVAFFPTAHDRPFQIVNFCVWIVLVCELLMQVYIRPRGYRALKKGREACSPIMSRFIGRFHLFFEGIALLLFFPEFCDLFGIDIGLSLRQMALHAVLGYNENTPLTDVLDKSRLHAFLGRFVYGLVRFRIFGLVRHWRNYYVFVTNGVSKHDVMYSHKQLQLNNGQDANFINEDTHNLSNTNNNQGPQTAEFNDDNLANASNIGTALMVINSQRALLIIWSIIALLPVITTIAYLGNSNVVSPILVKYLQETNTNFTKATQADCDFLQDTVKEWIFSVSTMTPLHTGAFVLKLELYPVRCPFQSYNITSSNKGLITSSFCQNYNVPDEWRDSSTKICENWNKTNIDTTDAKLAEWANVQRNVLTTETATVALMFNGTSSNFTVRAVYNQSATSVASNGCAFVLQLFFFFLVVVLLYILRMDAARLVLMPLKRMLRIILLYAKNPLAPPPTTRKMKKINRTLSQDIPYTHYSSSDSSDDETATGTPHPSLLNSSRTSSSMEEKNYSSTLGNYETEQLINAVTKITDLLRKCWGVAGANIISSNLTRGKDGMTAFNPCVPGKLVYGIFCFAAISNFDSHLRALKGEIMILINDVAAVLHGEVFRWALGDSGQCNKNLGQTFLMVFKIGDAKEVWEKSERATSLIFSAKSSTVTTRSYGKKGSNESNSGVVPGSMGGYYSRKKMRETGILRRRKQPAASRTFNSDDENHDGSKLKKSSKTAPSLRGGIKLSRQKKGISIKIPETAKRMDSLKLSSLPGISIFADRALIGILKSYAGIHRDQKLLNWKNDLRFGAGVGAEMLDMMIGMHAGWAVEGAVGSEYKIDATYLSPHVNMSARMMTASKQYGVSLLVSQAIEQLLSDNARSKLRHLDTVTVKGSTVKQRIYTYDARHKGVNFFLFNQSEEAADEDAENYRPSIWDLDQDITAMRQHISPEFESLFKKGREKYTSGEWQLAIQLLKQADEIIIQNAIDDGFFEDEVDTMKMSLNNDDPEAEENDPHLRSERGDGACRNLIAYMEARGGVAPDGWEGWRPLNSK